MNRASSPSLVFEVGDDTVQIRCSTMADGDFHLDGHRAALLHRRAAFAPGVWTQLDEVHGTAVLRVTHPGEHDFATGDAAITDRRNAVLAAWVGDCAPVALVGDDGTIAVVHAGWRGALAGVLQATVSQMSSGTVVAVLGHCIHPCCYEFGEPDRAPFRARFGAHVEARTSRRARRGALRRSTCRVWFAAHSRRWASPWWMPRRAPDAMSSTSTRIAVVVNWAAR